MSVVLLVEDSPSHGARYLELLRNAGDEVHEAASDQDLLDRLKEFRPQVVVLDDSRPDSTGRRVCREIRSDPKQAGVAILLLTARDDDQSVLAGLEAGADDHVARDSAPEIILDRVRKLVRCRQMASVSLLNEQLLLAGRLLLGVIHEIRNPLGVIRGNAELMQMALGHDHESARWIEPILRNAELLQIRLDHLMAAVRSGPPSLQPQELPPLVREAMDLFQRGTDPRRGQITVSAEFAPGLPIVRVDPGRLLQALLNLFANAQDAIFEVKREGTILVRASVTGIASDEKSWVKLDVQDEGTGVPESYLDRIFEPFFSTKPQGSGYGLYLAHEILREHGGRLTVCNVSGGGACFTLWLQPEVAPDPPAHDRTD